MGMNLPGRGGGGSRRASSRGMRPMTEINVTPFVDVMLVLLVIFMVAAPLLISGVPVELPKTEAKPLTGQDEPLSVTVKASGEIYLNENKTTIEELVPRLLAITQENRDLRIFVRGDTSVDYGRVLEVMGALNAAGYAKIGLLSEQKTVTPK